MGPRRGGSTAAQSLLSLTATLDSGSATQKNLSLEGLIEFFGCARSSQEALDDGSFHGIYEALFRCVLSEKANYYSGKKASVANAASRLRKCADCLRLAVGLGGWRAKRKTARAIVDHIIQVLPGPDEQYFEPLLKDYLKTMHSMLEVPSVVENLAWSSEGEGWEMCVDFCAEALSRYLGVDGVSDSSGGASPVPGPARGLSSALSRGRCAGGSLTHGTNGQLTDKMATDLVASLGFLVASPNAPVQRQAKAILATLMGVLQIRRSDQLLLKATFSAINHLFAHVKGNDVLLTQRLARGLVPQVTYWWRVKTLSRDDASINSLREEMIKALYASTPFLDSLSRDSRGDSLLTDLQDLLDALWSEYSKRAEKSRLQLDDLRFTSTRLPADHLGTGLFSLRPYQTAAELNWGLMEIMARLETICSQMRRQDLQPEAGKDHQPQKRRRIGFDDGRVLSRATSLDAGVRLTALQLVPFLIEQGHRCAVDMSVAMETLAVSVVSKQAATASWAMLACASLTFCDLSGNDSLSGDWKQLWQVGVRALSVSGTSRAASALLLSILRAKLIPAQFLAGDMTQIITAADVSGPAVVVDSSTALMLEMLHLRNTMFPNASQTTRSHILRWLFVKWNPADMVYASNHARHALPWDLANVLRACFGLPLLSMTPVTAFRGSILHDVARHKDDQFLTDYLLLLDDEDFGALAPHRPAGSTELDWFGQVPDQAGSEAAKSLATEFFQPKLQELSEMAEPWMTSHGDGPAQVSPDRLHSLVLACVFGALMLSELTQVDSVQSSEMETGIFHLFDIALTTALDISRDGAFLHMLLSSAAPCIPRLSGRELERLKKEQSYLLRLLATLASKLEVRTSRDRRAKTMMDMDNDDDDEFDTRSLGQKSPVSQVQTNSRRDVGLWHTAEAFYLETQLRLHLVEVVCNANGQTAFVPESLVDRLVALSDEQFLSCRSIVKEVFSSDLGTRAHDAERIVEAMGAIISNSRFSCCEAALCMCVDVIDAFVGLWTDDSLHVSAMIGDLYYHLVKTALGANMLSPTTQIWLSRLLFRLLKAKPSHAEMQLSSSRTTLLTLLRDGLTTVKFAIGLHLAELFGLYVLQSHDAIFVDILNSLPNDADHAEGIACRLFVLAELACHWPTLLRRCTYHIFETPGRVARSGMYASICMRKIARSLHLDSPGQLFGLFAPQLLYTWLDKDAIETIPYGIFGFASLADLLSACQTEAAAILMMRGREDETARLAQRLGIAHVDLICQGMTKITAYCLAHDIRISPLAGLVTGESRLRRLLGQDGFQEKLHVHFADIVGTLFQVVDQEEAIESYFGRDERFVYAADIMADIKACCFRDAELPPSQQPAFRAKYLQKELDQLCKRTVYQLDTLWKPALVVSIARQLLNTLHPVLGPFHACSVLRKIRVLLCLAGPQALSAYPLEMLLQSIRPFLTETESADDALGMSQYLLTKGRTQLQHAPSFVAGYALSTLADLSTLLDSRPCSTTQASQFKATMKKARLFHGWLAQYLQRFDSARFTDDEQRRAFRSMMQSAAQMGPSGNADKGTHEGSVLLAILDDWARQHQLLNDAAREVALSMLGRCFQLPKSRRQDMLGTDAEALRHSAAVWKSCDARQPGKAYLAWAGCVLGRSFAASGEIPKALLRESRLHQYTDSATAAGCSEEALLRLIGTLAVSVDCRTAGLAEAALRTIVSEAMAADDADVRLSLTKSLPEPLLTASDWGEYRSPPSDTCAVRPLSEAAVFEAGHLQSPHWAKTLAIFLATSVGSSVVLGVLPRLLDQVRGFAQQAFPFILHLVLVSQLGTQQPIKRQMSDATGVWLKCATEAGRNNLKLLIETLLYLRTRPMPNEASHADRLRWLDVSFQQAAAAAARCGMYKVALFFAELVSAEPRRGSRRSLAARAVVDGDAGDAGAMLLDIFENIDDPDAYYGLSQDASIATVLARLEYENVGEKSMAFRGAQYDSHLRRRDAASHQDEEALVRALYGLGLSGLSNAILRSRQALDASRSLDSTFTTARRLEMWNLPAPSSRDSHAVTMYKAYQGIQTGNDLIVVRNGIRDGLGGTVGHLASGHLKAARLRQHLAALAALTELDDMLTVVDTADQLHVLSVFEDRAKWMMSGRYADVSQMLSCRETTLSMLCKHGRLCLGPLKQKDLVLAQIKGMLLASHIFRFHRANQETLNLATTLTDLIAPSEAEGLCVDAAIRMAAADSLWDHGEIIPSIRMLQTVDDQANLKKQSVPVSRSDLLSKIGHRVSVARLESPDSIQHRYLKPALEELQGQAQGTDAGRVFHQFARFCDDQLQNPDSQQDLARLRHLKTGKGSEVQELRGMIQKAQNAQEKYRYERELARAEQWFQLDAQELRRLEQTRSAFVRLCLENYLLSLAASDDHNNDSIRFTALWLERAEDEPTNAAIKSQLEKAPTSKFAPLMIQLTSRLQDDSSAFHGLLANLVLRICLDHPYHGCYQLWPAARSRTNKKDEVAMSRQRAADRITKHLVGAAGRPVASIYPNIDHSNRAYHNLAMDRDAKAKAGDKLEINASPVGAAFLRELAKYPVPPPTMQLAINPSGDYSSVPRIVKFEPRMTIAGGLSAPKILTAVAEDGKRYKQLVKGGNDDLRQDAIMEQVFAAVSELLRHHRATRQRSLGIRTYKVLPLTATTGLIEFVSDTVALHDYLMPAHERYHPKDMKAPQCRKEISNAQTQSTERRIATFRRVTERYQPVLRYFFMENFVDPDEWFARRTAYTRTTAAISMLGHVLGLGDRHGHNILLDSSTGEVVHIDLGVAFEMGRILPVPELVPFRLTRDIVDGMGITKTEGVFRRCCEFTLDALREETYSIMTVLGVLRYDPLYSWSISPVRLAKLQKAVSAEDEGAARLGGAGVGDGDPQPHQQKPANEPSEADRALEVVRKKLSKTLSVTATVNDLINQATDERNLAVLYSGWAAYS